MWWKGGLEGLNWLIVTPAVLLSIAHSNVAELGLGAFGPPASVTLTRWLAVGGLLAAGSATLLRNPRCASLAAGAVLSGWTVKAVGRQREGMMIKGDEVRETRGNLVGWACTPTTAVCQGKRNDLVSDNAPAPNTKPTQVVSLGSGKHHRSARR